MSPKNIFYYIKNLPQKYNLLNCKEFKPSLLAKDESILRFCKQNKCNNYNKNYMCPPFFQPPDFSKFRYGVILQYMCLKERWREEKIKFHKIILAIEDYINMHFNNINFFSFIGGSCELCNPCEVVFGKECRFPYKARPSLEAAGINVINLLKELELPYKFSTNRVIWTGAILFTKK